MSSFNRRECLGCGQPCDVYHCYSCTYPKCGVILLTGICLNCTYGDGKPVTYCVCEGPLRGGFCLFCNSRAKNSYTYDPNAYSFNDSSSNFNLLPQPQFKTYLCKLCGNNSHDGYDCQQQFLFVYEQEPSYSQNYNGNYYPHDSPGCLCCDNYRGSHATFQCQLMDQNTDSSGFDQIQSSQYPVIHHLSQEDVEEVLQDKEKFMQDTQTFLEKFNHYSFKVTPRVLMIAWEKIYKIKYVFTEPEEISELMCKLREDVRNIREELKSFDAITPILPTKEPEYSLSMRYEYLSTTPKTKLDEVTESSAKNLLPILSEYKVTSDDESGCEVPAKDESSLVFTNFSNPLFNDNGDFTSSDDKSLFDEDVPIEELKIYSNPFFDDEEINSDKLDPDCFNAESDLIESFLNRDTLIDSSHKFDFLLKEFSEELNAEIADMIVESLSQSPIPVEDSDSLMEEIDLFLATDDLLPPRIESDGYDSEGDIHFLKNLLSDDSILFPENESSNHQDDLLFPRPPSEPPDVEFDFELNSGEVISAVKNNNDELNEDECFHPGGEIDVFTNVEDDDYFPYIFFIQIFLPYLIYPEVSLLLLSAGSEDTIFDPGISV
nr:hypothetical protein [Tanacetum cinerariifolium]